MSRQLSALRTRLREHETVIAVREWAFQVRQGVVTRRQLLGELASVRSAYHRLAAHHAHQLAEMRDQRDAARIELAAIAVAEQNRKAVGGGS